MRERGAGGVGGGLLTLQGATAAGGTGRGGMGAGHYGDSGEEGDFAKTPLAAFPFYRS